MTRHVWLIGALVLCLLSGCATYIEGGKANGVSEGIQYSLPVPVIRVTPQANGTMQVDVDYLPDPDNTYVLRTRSFVSSYTLDVERENGLLKKVSLDSKSDVVASAIAESAGNLIKARSDLEAKEQETAAAAAKEQAKALSDAQLALVIAQAKLRTLESDSTATADKKAEARIAVAEAQAKVDYLASVARGDATTTFNAINNDGTPVAAGPVLFRVVPVGRYGVKLVAFDGPSIFPTSTAAKPPPAQTPDLSAVIEGTGVIARVNGQPSPFKLLVNRPGARLDLSRSRLLKVGSPTNRIDKIDQANSNAVNGQTVVFVTLKPSIGNGSYSLVPVFMLGDQPAEADPVDFVVR